MENKENKHTMTKIPIPLKPLPELSKHLLKSHVASQQRKPLKTLSGKNVPGGSTNQEKKSVLDSRHVTLRRETEELDWNYAIFKNDHSENKSADGNENSSRIPVVRTPVQTNEGSYDGNRRICSDELLKITPSPGESSEPVGHIKKSLKRPHSQELQAVTPTHSQENREEVKRRLVLNENVRELLKSPDYWEKTYTLMASSCYADNALDHLIGSQQKALGTPAIPRVSRACVINWLIKVNTSIDRNPAIVQTACWYMDSYFSVRPVRVGKIQLIASACYWMAQKLHGPTISASNMVKYSGCAFTKSGLFVAEQHVLRHLRFPKMPVIPHDFITYLAWLCDEEHPTKIEMAATFLCMSGLMVTNELCEEVPSVIACAAIKTAVSLLGEAAMLQKLMLCTMFTVTVESASFPQTCSILQRAARTVADPDYDYNSPLNRYGTTFKIIALQIISAIRNH